MEAFVGIILVAVLVVLAVRDIRAERRHAATLRQREWWENYRRFTDGSADE
jgi:hypothetical protein